MLMGQVSQHVLVFFTHAASEVRIIQVTVACVFRHVLQDAQAVLNRFLALRRHLLPFGKDVILDVLPLLRSHSAPLVRGSAHILLLLRRQVPELFLALR